MKKIFIILTLVLACFTSNAKKVDYSCLDEIINKVVLSTTDIQVDTVIVLNGKEVEIDACHYHINGYLITVNVYTDKKAIINHCCKLFKELGFEEYSEYHNYFDMARLHTSESIKYVPMPIEAELSRIKYELMMLKHNIRVMSIKHHYYY